LNPIHHVKLKPIDMTSKHIKTGLLLSVFMLWFKLLAVSQINVGGESEHASPYFIVISEDIEQLSFPLKSTNVKVVISGVIADVFVKQVYTNTGSSTLEAVYVFPASTRSAVYDMVMKVGEREIRAVVEEKGKARTLYRDARKKGQTVSLLEEERPNVFKMKVANIQPGARVEVNMRYTELLVPTDKVYTFVYPTVVGPRYVSNGELESHAVESWVVNSYLQADAKLSSTFNLELDLSTSIPIKQMRCDTHQNKIDYKSLSLAQLVMTESDDGQRDFVMHYSLSGDGIESGVLLYEEPNGENYFLAMVQPAKRTIPDAIPPREYVFIVDVSGSMSGFPLDVSKQMMKELLGHLKLTDVFNIVCFAGGSEVFSEESVKATQNNIDEAIEFIERRQGGGGTELLSALDKSLQMKRADNFSTSFLILTDGYVTVEKATFDLIRNKMGEANFFAFGIGRSVNRHLIEGMAHVGYGEPFFVMNQAEAAPVRQRFNRYVSQAQMTNISYQLEGLEFYDVLPQYVPDLLADRPLIISGKYKGVAKGKLHIKGLTGEKEIMQTVKIDPKKDHSEKALKYLWAREKIRLLADYKEVQFDSDIREEITALGIKYNLLTEFTSFIAIDSTTNIVSAQKGNDNESISPLPTAGDILNIVDCKAVLCEELSVDESECDLEVIYMKVEEEEAVEDLFMTVEEMPEYPGGNEALEAFIATHLVYPPQAKENGVCGSVHISFAIDVDGSIVDIKILRGVSPELDAEAIRLIKAMPLWKPGKSRGKAVKVSYTIPVQFTLG